MMTNYRMLRYPENTKFLKLWVSFHLNTPLHLNTICAALPLMTSCLLISWAERVLRMSSGTVFFQSGGSASASVSLSHSGVGPLWGVTASPPRPLTASRELLGLSKLLQIKNQSISKLTTQSKFKKKTNFSLNYELSLRGLCHQPTQPWKVRLTIVVKKL